MLCCPSLWLSAGRSHHWTLREQSPAARHLAVCSTPPALCRLSPQQWGELVWLPRGSACLGGVGHVLVWLVFPGELWSGEHLGAEPLGADPSRPSAAAHDMWVTGY